jgi:hypothetical protein
MRWLALALLTFLPCAVSAGGALNQVAIHYQYSDGDFPAVIEAIDEFTSSHKKYDRKDSIFIAKHLAVVYTANPETRERGKYYMYQLLELVPSAELVDMYVSDEIDLIFAKVKREYSERRKEREETVKRNERERFWKNPWLWAGGAMAVGAAGYLTYEAATSGAKDRPEYVVP